MGGCSGGSWGDLEADDQNTASPLPSWGTQPLTPREILMALEQVTPDFPQMTFSVRTLKVGCELLAPQSSCRERVLKRIPRGPHSGSFQTLAPGSVVTVASVYSQLPSNTKRCPSKVMMWPSP